MTLAVFECPDASEAIYQDTQYGKSGACRACTNEEAAQLAGWHGVELYREHDRVCVRLGWSVLRSRYVIVGSYLRGPSAYERPALDFLTHPIPGLDLAGFVEIIEPRPTDTTLRPSDFLRDDETTTPAQEKPAEPAFAFEPIKVEPAETLPCGVQKLDSRHEKWRLPGGTQILGTLQDRIRARRRQPSPSKRPSDQRASLSVELSADGAA